MVVIVDGTADVRNTVKGPEREPDRIVYLDIACSGEAPSATLGMTN